MANDGLNNAKADDLMDKANKKMNGFWPFGNGKFEEAEEMFTKAANLYKLCKKWQEAGDAFMKASECSAKLGNKHEVATAYVSASGCYKKCSASDAINCLRMAVEIHIDLGRFSIAAKHQKEIGEMYETENDLEEAIAAYETAAQFYQGENATSSANTVLLKVALFSAQLEQYDKAIEIYEQVAANSIESTLLKWNVKEYYLCAGLCHMCTGEIHTAKRALERYMEMDVTFSATRECEFLQKTMFAYEEGDVDAFTAAIVDFDKVTTLNNWKTTILLRIKNALKKDEDNLT
jgi:alpha-soluble NSF attachment protein